MLAKITEKMRGIKHRMQYRIFLSKWEDEKQVHTQPSFVFDLITLGRAIPKEALNTIDQSNTYLYVHYSNVDAWLTECYKVHRALTEDRLLAQPDRSSVKMTLDGFLTTSSQYLVEYHSAHQSACQTLYDLYTLLNSHHFTLAKRQGVVKQLRELLLTGINFVYTGVNQYYST